MRCPRAGWRWCSSTTGCFRRAPDPVVAGRCDRLLPGAGDFDLVAFVEAVSRTGFDGVVSPEVLSDDVRAMGPGAFTRKVLAASAPYWT